MLHDLFADQCNSRTGPPTELLTVLPSLIHVKDQLVARRASWGEIVRTIEQRLGSSGLAIFSKIEQGQLLSLAGKPGKAVQYAIGNPLLAIQMIEHMPEVALYAPLRLVVYETQDGRTFAAYDRFGSLLSQYAHPDVAQIAQLVEQKLEALVIQATGVEARARA